MRDFNYSLLKDLKWDSEIVSYLTAIHEAKGKQELYLKQQPEKLKIEPKNGCVLRRTRLFTFQALPWNKPPLNP